MSGPGVALRAVCVIIAAGIGNWQRRDVPMTVAGPSAIHPDVVDQSLASKLSLRVHQ
jgi:hypothetical protein